MSGIVITDDVGLKWQIAERELAASVGTTLAETYPGYRWRIEPHPHPTKPFVDIRLEAGHAMFGATIKPYQFYSASSFKAKVIEIGGEMLERFHLNRRAFDEPEFLGRQKNFAGLILPDL